jgi:predicted homoserine dehydrogenase-like protein
VYEKLRNPERKIRVALIGTGAMGKGLFYQCSITPAFECVALADLDLQAAIDCARSLGRQHVIVETADALNDAIRQGLLAVTGTCDLVAGCHRYDCLIESTSSIMDAARYSIAALQNRRHLVLMNAEVDQIFGPHLMDLAGKNGVTCTSCDGDQHTVLKRMIDDIQLWGFEIVMAGNIKGFLDRYSNPTTIIPEADKRNLDYRMCAAFTDGTKLNIEMSLLANHLGLTTRTPGMRGPKARSVHEVFDLFDFNELWTDRRGCVDYLLGAEPNGGVFVIGYQNNPYQQSMLQYYKMGRGPFYLFYRPYHLCHVESLRCVAEACWENKALLQPSKGFVTNVYAYAKTDLKKGAVLDGIGGYACYGMVENVAENETKPGLPICLSEDLTLKTDLKKDAKIELADVEYEPDSYAFDLFRKSQEVSARCKT